MVGQLCNQVACNNTLKLVLARSIRSELPYKMANVSH